MGTQQMELESLSKHLATLWGGKGTFVCGTITHLRLEIAPLPGITQPSGVVEVSSVGEANAASYPVEAAVDQ